MRGVEIKGATSREGQVIARGGEERRGKERIGLGRSVGYGAGWVGSVDTSIDGPSLVIENIEWLGRMCSKGLVLNV